MNSRSPSHPHRRRQRHLAALVGAAILVVFIGLSPTQPTEAAWTRSTYVNTTLMSGKVYPVTSLSCTASSGIIATSIGFRWTQPATTGNGLVPTSYKLVWTGTAGSGQTTVTGLSGSVPGSTLSELGSSTVTVYANDGTWQSAISTQTRTITTISALGIIVSWTCD